jgi:hypothetical protein
VIRDIADNIFPPRSTSTWTSPELTYPQTRTAAHPPLFTLLFHRSLQLNRNRNPNLHPYPSDPHNLAHSFPCSIAPSLPHLLHRYLTYSVAAPQPTSSLSARTVPARPPTPPATPCACWVALAPLCSPPLVSSPLLAPGVRGYSLRSTLFSSFLIRFDLDLIDLSLFFLPQSIVPRDWGTWLVCGPVFLPAPIHRSPGLGDLARLRA